MANLFILFHPACPGANDFKVYISDTGFNAPTIDIFKAPLIAPIGKPAALIAPAVGSMLKAPCIILPISIIGL